MVKTYYDIIHMDFGSHTLHRKTIVIHFFLDNNSTFSHLEIEKDVTKEISPLSLIQTK